MAYLSKLSANLSLNISDFRKGLQQGQAEVKAFEKATRRALNSISGRGGASGGFTQNERFRQAMIQGRAAGLDKGTLQRARSKQAAFTTGGRLGSAREELGGLASGSQMDLSPLFQKATASVQKMNAELASSKTLTASTYREALRDVKAFEAAVVSAKTKEASMTKANQQLTSLVTGGAAIQKGRDAAAASLDKQRSAALYKEFQDRDRLRKQSVEKAKASENSLAKQREKNLLKEYQDRLRAQERLNRQRDKEGSKAFQERIGNRFSATASRAFLDERTIASASSKLQAYLGIMGHIGTESSEVNAKFRELVRLNDQASKKGTKGFHQMAGAINQAEMELNQLLAAQARSAGVNVGGVRGISSTVAAAGGKGGFGKFGGNWQMMFQQGIFAIEDMASSTDGLRGALRGASNNLTMMATQFGAWGMGAAVAITTMAQLYLAFTKNDDATKKAEKAEKDLAAARSKVTAVTERLMSKMEGQGLGDAMQARVQAMRDAEEVRSASKGAQNAINEDRQQGIASGWTPFFDQMQQSLGKAIYSLYDSGENVRRGTKFGTVEGMSNWMSANGIEGARYFRDWKGESLGSSTAEWDVLNQARSLSQEDKDRLLITDVTLESMKELLVARDMERFADLVPELSSLANQRAENIGSLAEYRSEGGIQGQADWFATSIEGITEVMDEAAAALSRGEMTFDEFSRVADMAAGMQEKLNDQVKEYVREQEQQAAFNSRRKSALDSYLATTDQGREQSIIDFLRGGQLAGVETAQLRTEARAQFGGTEGDMIRQAGAVSKAPIGATALRDAAGAAEQTRMLAGQDSAATTRDVNMKQLEEQQRTNELIDRLIRVQPGLAE